MSAQPVQVTDTQFESVVLDSDGPVLVDFWAPWCMPCRMVAPVLEELASEYEGRLLIAKVNTDEDFQAAQQYRVQGIPTMILFNRGVEVDRTVGALPKPQLESWIESTVSRATPSTAGTVA
jgi:thioredoxin 1